MATCLQCDSAIPEDDRTSLEVWLADADDDDAPLAFCWPGCAGIYLTDLSLR